MKFKGYKPLLIISIILILFSGKFFAQEKAYNIDYYGVVTTQVDQNMSKMTSDLYYSQLCEINNFSVSDRRITDSLAKIPDNTLLSDTALSFYTVINKAEDSNKWTAIINIFDKNKNTLYSQEKSYDSYYKILMEPKATLQESIRNLITNGVPVNTTTDKPKELFQDTSSLVSTEFLSGTWEGEKTIDKIVIMRGGRGFVIFENGASMNITVELNKTGVIITQKGKSNASFFPELPRQIALTEAIEAEPIKWEFSVTNNDTLTGTKTTLIQDGNNAIKGQLNVVWTRK